MREENDFNSLPVVTIASVDRLGDLEYRERCVNRLLEIVLYAETYRGTARIFIP